jgi:hypothetical protein
LRSRARRTSAAVVAGAALAVAGGCSSPADSQSLEPTPDSSRVEGKELRDDPSFGPLGADPLPMTDVLVTGDGDDAKVVDIEGVGLVMVATGHASDSPTDTVAITVMANRGAPIFGDDEVFSGLALKGVDEVTPTPKSSDRAGLFIRPDCSKGHRDGNVVAAFTGMATDGGAKSPALVIAFSLTVEDGACKLGIRALGGIREFKMDRSTSLTKGDPVMAGGPSEGHLHLF